MNKIIKRLPLRMGFEAGKITLQTSSQKQFTHSCPTEESLNAKPNETEHRSYEASAYNKF